MSDLKLVIRIDAENAKKVLSEMTTQSRDLASTPISLDIQADASEAEAAAAQASEALSDIPSVAPEIGADDTEANNAIDAVKSKFEQMLESFRTQKFQIDIPGIAALGLAVNAVTDAIGKVIGTFGNMVNESNLAELAVKRLSVAMQVKGEYTEQDIQSMQSYATQMQKITTVGDEQTLGLITMAYNFDITKEKRIEAVEGAIGLAARFRESGLTQETALKGIALAMQGNYSQLGRYIPALRDAGSESEKMAVLQSIMSEGFTMAKDEITTGSGALQQYKNLVGDLKEKIGDIIKIALIPLVKVMTSVTQFLNDHPLLFKTIAAGVVSLITLFTAWKLSTSALAVAQLALNAVMAVSPIGWIVIGLGALITVLAVVINHVGGFARAWEYAKASMTIAWEYIKAFGSFLYSSMSSYTQILTYPYQVLFRTVKTVFSEIGQMLQSLLSGDFKGFADKVSSGFSQAFQETNASIKSSFSSAMGAFDGLGQKSATIWSTVASSASSASNSAKQQADSASEAVQASTELAQIRAQYITDEIERVRALNELERASEVDRAVQAGASASLIAQINEHYKKKTLEDEQSILDERASKARELAELRIKYLSDEITRAKEQNALALQDELLKAQKIGASEQDLANIREHFRQKDISDERDINLEKARRAKEQADQVASLERTKLEAITAYYESIRFADQAYYDWKLGMIKSSADQELQALLDAGMRREQAEQMLNYRINKQKKDLDREYLDHLVKSYQESHQIASLSLNAMQRGYEEFGSSLTRSDMTGQQRREAIWNAMKASFIRSIVSMTSAFLKQKALELLATKTSEAEKTAVVGAFSAKQIGISLLTTLKKVGMAIWEMGSKVFAFFAALGPLGIPMAIGTIASITALISALRKGFASGGYTGQGGKYDVRGLVHADEVVYESEITRPNLKELLSLRSLLQRGHRLSDLLRPSIMIPSPMELAPVTTGSYASGGYSGSGSDLFAVFGSALDSLRQEIVSLKIELINKDLTVVNNISANDLVRKADPALLNKQVYMGSQKRGVL